MIILELKRGKSSMVVPLKLPATPGELGEAFSRLDSIGEPGTTRLADCVSPIANLSQYIKGADPDRTDDLRALNQLAGLIDRMSEQDRHTFAGALDAESINGLGDVLGVAQRLEEYAFLPNVHNDRELGQVLVFAGYLDIPHKVRPYVSYERVGAEFYADHGGAYRPDGYTLRKSELPLYVLNSDKPEPCPVNMDLDEVISIGLEANGRQHTVILPAEEEYLDEVCDYLGIEGFAQAKITECTCETAGLSDLLPMDCISVEGANELAWAVEEMLEEDGELLKFCSVLAVEKPQDFPAAVKLAKDMGNYERVPTDEVEYGREVLKRLGASEELLSIIENYMNLSFFGDGCMVEDGVAITQYGGIRRLSEPFPSEQAQGQQMM